MNEHIETMARIQEVSACTTMAQSTIWQFVKEKKFPQPIKLSIGVTVWKIKDVNDYINGAWIPAGKEVEDEVNSK